MHSFWTILGAVAGTIVVIVAVIVVAIVRTLEKPNGWNG